MRARVGTLVKRRRQALGWTQDQLAYLSGVNQGHISQIERNLKTPTLPTLNRLRDALALPDDEYGEWIEACSPPERRRGAA